MFARVLRDLWCLPSYPVFPQFPLSLGGRICGISFMTEHSIGADALPLDQLWVSVLAAVPYTEKLGTDEYWAARVCKCVNTHISSASLIHLHHTLFLLVFLPSSPPDVPPIPLLSVCPLPSSSPLSTWMSEVNIFC